MIKIKLVTNKILVRKNNNIKIRFSRKQTEILEFYAFIAPWFIIFILLGLIPLIYGFYMSLTNFTGYNLEILKFVGLNNYKRAFIDTDALYSLGRTFLVTIINVPLGVSIGFLMAVLLNSKIKAVGLFRTIFYLPAIIPIVASAAMWRVIMSKNGIINDVLSNFGISRIDWLGYDHATLSLIMVLLWGCGGGLLINLSGLKGISAELYEAATIDGANGAQNFFKITLPLMTPVLFFNLIMGIIQSLQIFATPILLTSQAAGNNTSGLLGTPIRPNYLYLVHAFKQIFAFNRYGYGLALLWIMFVIVLIFTILIFKTSRYWVHYEVDQGGEK